MISIRKIFNENNFLYKATSSWIDLVPEIDLNFEKNRSDNQEDAFNLLLQNTSVNKIIKDKINSVKSVLDEYTADENIIKTSIYNHLLKKIQENKVMLKLLKEKKEDLKAIFLTDKNIYTKDYKEEKTNKEFEEKYNSDIEKIENEINLYSIPSNLVDVINKFYEERINIIEQVIYEKKSVFLNKVKKELRDLLSSKEVNIQAVCKKIANINFFDDSLISGFNFTESYADFLRDNNINDPSIFKKDSNYVEVIKEKMQQKIQELDEKNLPKVYADSNTEWFDLIGDEINLDLSGTEEEIFNKLIHNTSIKKICNDAEERAIQTLGLCVFNEDYFKTIIFNEFLTKAKEASLKLQNFLNNKEEAWNMYLNSIPMQTLNNNLFNESAYRNQFEIIFNEEYKNLIEYVKQYNNKEFIIRNVEETYNICVQNNELHKYLENKENFLAPFYSVRKNNNILREYIKDIIPKLKNREITIKEICRDISQLDILKDFKIESCLKDLVSYEAYLLDNSNEFNLIYEKNNINIDAILAKMSSVYFSKDNLIDMQLSEEPSLNTLFQKDSYEFLKETLIEEIKNRDTIDKIDQTIIIDEEKMQEVVNIAEEAIKESSLDPDSFLQEYKNKIITLAVGLGAITIYNKDGKEIDKDAMNAMLEDDLGFEENIWNTSSEINEEGNGDNAYDSFAELPEN
jgi:hypothetical protein